MLLVHRGDCASVRRSRQGVAAEEAGQVLQRPDAAQYPVCRPERALIAALQ
ncbi:DUF6233 domain-containing protein [Streptomyces sp. NPDC088732]|uniref:DUF6233 domain-containing protein n=1 Tax=Streptomyces sp. NPDC088732 TaxID=3365879 RepID=UPI00381CDE53